MWTENFDLIRKEYKEYFSHAEAIHEFYIESLEEESQGIGQVPPEFLELIWKAAGYKPGTSLLAWRKIANDAIVYITEWVS